MICNFYYSLGLLVVGLLNVDSVSAQGGSASLQSAKELSPGYETPRPGVVTAALGVLKPGGFALPQLPRDVGTIEIKFNPQFEGTGQIIDVGKSCSCIEVELSSKLVTDPSLFVKVRVDVEPGNLSTGLAFVIDSQSQPVRYTFYLSRDAPPVVRPSRLTFIHDKKSESSDRTFYVTFAGSSDEPPTFLSAESNVPDLTVDLPIVRTTSLLLSDDGERSYRHVFQFKAKCNASKILAKGELTLRFESSWADEVLTVPINSEEARRLQLSPSRAVVIGSASKSIFIKVLGEPEVLAEIWTEAGAQHTLGLEVQYQLDKSSPGLVLQIAPEFVGESKLDILNTNGELMATLPIKRLSF